MEAPNKEISELDKHVTWSREWCRVATLKKISFDFEVPFASVSKRVLVQKFCYENEFDFRENKLAGETHFHNGFALRLVLTTRLERTRKWPILNYFRFAIVVV